MAEVASTATDRRYRAFISYSHADQAWADWLHKTLETYRVPSRLVGTKTAAGTIPRRLAPIFRDRDELASAADLGRKVNEALAESANLVVICSPRAAASRWVNEEVLAWKRQGRGDRIFCLIVDGEPNASDSAGREAGECFVPALRFAVDANGELSRQRTEPIAADARDGKDGKANAKLKLIAGMLDVGFDALKQREQQRRQRRLAWIAGFGFLGMATMSVLAGIAMHERNQARLQREQAEELVGFMLGNLRTKLEAVSRLDILDEVADHAMGYFEAQPDAGSIDSRAKRAAALLLLGRVRFDQGRMDDAERAFSESLRLGKKLATESNHAPAQDLAVVDAQFWLGRSAWQRGEMNQALARFQAALPIVVALTRTHPDSTEALERLAWMHQNIGHVYEAQGTASRAMHEYTAQLQAGQQLVARHPDDRSYQQALGDAHDNIAALLYARGDFDGAERHYRAERDLLAKLVARDPRDAETKARLAIAQTYLAQVAEALGHVDSARDSLRQAMAIGDSTLSSDPDNMDKLGDLASYCRRLARNLRVSGEPATAGPLLERAATLYTRMLSQAPSDVRAQYGLAATRLEQARLAWQTGNAARAQDRASAALQGFTILLHAQNYERDASLGVASVLLLRGKIDMAAGDAQAAWAQWSQALDAMRIFGSDSHDPDQLNVQAELLVRLGRDDEARALIARLDAMHYRDPAFVAWRRESTIAATASDGTVAANARKSP